MTGPAPGVPQRRIKRPTLLSDMRQCASDERQRPGPSFQLRTWERAIRALARKPKER